LQGQYIEENPPAQVQHRRCAEWRGARGERGDAAIHRGAQLHGGPGSCRGERADTSFNGERTVATVPDSTHVTFNNAGANTTSGSGGWVGTPEQRFLSVGPQIVNHVQHQNAVARAGLG
jgi:hypothetical protein